SPPLFPLSPLSPIASFTRARIALGASRLPRPSAAARLAMGSGPADALSRGHENLRSRLHRAAGATVLAPSRLGSSFARSPIRGMAWLHARSVRYRTQFRPAKIDAELICDLGHNVHTFTDKIPQIPRADPDNIPQMPRGDLRDLHALTRERP